MPGMRRCDAFALFLSLGCTTRPPARPPAPSESVVAEASEIAAAFVAEQQLPGASVAVMSGDDIVLARGYGVESVERADSVTPATVFELGSISKQLTAALVMKLAEEGRLSLDDPVARHLPSFTQLPASLTIRHLLTHTSGMREVFVQPALGAALMKPGTPLDEFAALAAQAPSDFTPGSRWSYSSTNYLMLGMIAERLTSQRVEDALRSRFLGPLGLSSIRQCPPHPGGARGEARGHLRTAQGQVPHPPENFNLFVAAGGLCGSASDLARWTRALATGRVVSPRSWSQMTTPASISGGGTADYGMGVVLVSPDGARRIGHGGYGGGFSAQAAYYPEKELTVVVMLNRFTFAEHLERRVARRLLGLPEATSAEVALSAEERQRYAGSYDIGIPGAHPEVVERDGKLWFVSRPLPPLPLTYVGNDEFVREGQPYGYRLRFGPDSPAREVRILGMGMMHWYGRRRP